VIISGHPDMVLFIYLLSLINLSFISGLLLSGRVVSPTSTLRLYGELRILIHGTKNAYTTLRPYDLVMYELPRAIGSCTRALGVYSSEDSKVFPLCNHVEGSSEFFHDQLQSPLSAEELKSQGRLLRVVSSDRRGTDCFLVEEYLDSDVYIPVRIQEAAAALVAPTQNVQQLQLQQQQAQVQQQPQLHGASQDSLQFVSSGELDASIAKVEARLEVANLKSILTELVSEKQRRSGIHEPQLSALVSTLTSTVASSSLSHSPLAPSPGTTTSPLVTSAQHRLEQVVSDKAPLPVGPYSQAIKAQGMVYVSGCLGIDPQSQKLVEGGIIFQTSQVFDNIKNILEAAGSDVNKIVKVTVIVKDLTDMQFVNRIYADALSDCAVLPARTTFAASSLPLGALVEVDIVAMA